MDERHYALQVYYSSRDKEISGGRICFLKSNSKIEEDSRLIKRKVRELVKKDSVEFDIKGIKAIKLNEIHKDIYRLGIW